MNEVHRTCDNPWHDLAVRLFAGDAARPIPWLAQRRIYEGAHQKPLVDAMEACLTRPLRRHLMDGTLTPSMWLTSHGALLQETAGRPPPCLPPPTPQAEQTADIIVLGAGAAGLAAAGVLHDAGHRVMVLEAQPQVGGRAITDTQTFATAVDLGAQRLHSGGVSPLRSILENLGFTLVADTAANLVYLGTPGEDPQANAQQVAAARRRLETALAGASAVDVGAGTVLPAPRDAWDALALSQMGPLESGVDIDQISTADYAQIFPESQDDYYVAEGLGTAVAALGLGLAVRLNQAVTQVVWRAAGVAVRAGDTVYLGKKLLITASTGLLFGGDVEFIPPLPAWKREALHRVPMGQYEKVIMEFSAPIFGGAPPGARVQTRLQPHKPIDFCLMPPWRRRPGAPAHHVVAIAYVGGRFAEALRAAGDRAASDYALAQLSQIYGHVVHETWVRSQVTHWHSTMGGAFSAARPGGAAARAALAQSIDDVLFFAGEACETPLPGGGSWATHVVGAHRSGLQVATHIASRWPRSQALAPAAKP